MKRTLLCTALLSLLVLPRLASTGEPTADELLKRYDQVMSPKTFDGLLLMVAHRQDEYGPLPVVERPGEDENRMRHEMHEDIRQMRQEIETVAHRSGQAAVDRTGAAEEHLLGAGGRQPQAGDRDDAHCGPRHRASWRHDHLYLDDQECRR